MSANTTGMVLQRTPLTDRHRALGAKLVEFSGWEMPVSYRGIIEEHHAVRSAAGLFDVSHMGEIEVVGPHAAATCQRLTTNDVRRLANGHVQYTLLCREDGGVVDDVTLYRVNGQRFFFCVNAGNIAKDLAWIESHAGAATVIDRSVTTALIALQGPAAAGILTGSFVVETLFGVPGMGQWFVKGAINRDYTVVMGVIIVYALLIIALNLVADILYGWLDPRVRYD